MQKIILNKSEVTQITGVSPVTLWRWCRAGIFPKPVQLGPSGGRMGWRRSDVEAWAAGLATAGGNHDDS